MSELIKWLRKEANRNSRMQGEKREDGSKLHTCSRRKTFRHRAFQLNQAATELETAQQRIKELEEGELCSCEFVWSLTGWVFKDVPLLHISPATFCPTCGRKAREPDTPEGSE